MKTLFKFYERYWRIIAIMLLIVIPIIFELTKAPTKLTFWSLSIGVVQFLGTLLYAKLFNR